MDALGLTVCVVVALAATWWGAALLPSPGPHEWLSSGALWRVPSGSVALTFDDGPDPRWTPAILDLLADHGARATFFVVGRRASLHPQLIERIAAEGHTLGNHTWSHPSLVRLSPSRIASELDRCQRAVAEIVGSAPCLVRPPFGHRDARFYRETVRRGLRPVMWSMDSRDWFHRTPRRVVERIKTVSDGDIVLLHDGRPDGRATLQALRELLPRLTAAGLVTAIPGASLLPPVRPGSGRPDDPIEGGRA